MSNSDPSRLLGDLGRGIGNLSKQSGKNYPEDVVLVWVFGPQKANDWNPLVVIEIVQLGLDQNKC